jgi:hypothetical protein
VSVIFSQNISVYRKTMSHPITEQFSALSIQEPARKEPPARKIQPSAKPKHSSPSSSSLPYPYSQHPHPSIFNGKSADIKRQILDDYLNKLARKKDSKEQYGSKHLPRRRQEDDSDSDSDSDYKDALCKKQRELKRGGTRKSKRRRNRKTRRRRKN